MTLKKEKASASVIFMFLFLRGYLFFFWRALLGLRPEGLRRNTSQLS
jgi:hypothetical protein